MRGHKCLFLAPLLTDLQTRVSAPPEFKDHSRRLFAQIVVLTLGRRLPEAECPGSTVLMAEKPSPVRCAECQQLLKDYADASLKRVRAHGNLKLANLRSDSETMEMLAEAAALAYERLEEVKRKIREHDSTRHAFQNLPAGRAERG